MAKNPTSPEQSPPAAGGGPEKEGGVPMKKLIMIGVPLFLVQVVAIYFIVTKVLAPAPAAAGTTSAPVEHVEGKHGGEGGSEEHAENIYIVKDLIVNPAGTNGTRFLLTTVGFGVTTVEAKTELEEKDTQVRDALNTILTSKDLVALSSIADRETLRTEITRKVAELVKRGTLTNVYFSKFIIQ
jgi:flagellar protein FliL